MTLVPADDQPNFGGVRWFRCTACGRYVDESKAVDECPHCHGQGFKEPVTGARRGPVIGGQKTYLPVQREELIESLKQEFRPGDYEKFIAEAEPLRQDQKWTLLYDLRFPDPQGWSHYSNASLIPLFYGEAHPVSDREVARFQKMRKRLREQFAPLLPAQYKDTRVTEYVYEEPPTILVGDTVTGFQSFEEMLIMAREGYRKPRRDLAAFAREPEPDGDQRAK